MNALVRGDLRHIYQGLFCDSPETYFGPDTPDQTLWSTARDTYAKSRLRLLAFHLLRQRAIDIGETLVLGIILEIGLGEGLDVLAVYRDGSARYLNYSGKLIIWETKTAEFDARIDEAFMKGEQISLRSARGLNHADLLLGQGHCEFLFLYLTACISVRVRLPACSVIQWPAPCLQCFKISCNRSWSFRTRQPKISIKWLTRASIC